MTVWDFMNIIKKKKNPLFVAQRIWGKLWGRSEDEWASQEALFPKQKKVKQNKHLPVSFFHENEARELEVAVGGRVGVNSIPNTPSYKNMKYTQI